MSGLTTRDILWIHFVLHLFYTANWSTWYMALNKINFEQYGEKVFLAAECSKTTSFWGVTLVIYVYCNATIICEGFYFFDSRLKPCSTSLSTVRLLSSHYVAKPLLPTSGLYRSGMWANTELNKNKFFYLLVYWPTMQWELNYTVL